MSIILKGIDLPEKNLRVICLFPHGAEELVVIDADSGATAGRPIQTIQIPKDHGRLIDGDWAKYNLENYSDLPTKYLHMDLVREAIEDAPTILEAEEK